MIGSPHVINRMIVVRCGVEKAFRTWTEQIDVWWPKEHSRSGDPDIKVFIERHMGGRIYERTPGGAEYEWGRVIAWEPTSHFAYHWFLGSSPAQPTQVDVRFSPYEQEGTTVDIIHRATQLTGDLWQRNNARYCAAWDGVLPSYVETCNIDG